MTQKSHSQCCKTEVSEYGKCKECGKTCIEISNKLMTTQKYIEENIKDIIADFNLEILKGSFNDIEVGSGVVITNFDKIEKFWQEKIHSSLLGYAEMVKNGINDILLKNIRTGGDVVVIAILNQHIKKIMKDVDSLLTDQSDTQCPHTYIENNMVPDTCRNCGKIIDQSDN